MDSTPMPILLCHTYCNAVVFTDMNEIKTPINSDILTPFGQIVEYTESQLRPRRLIQVDSYGDAFLVDTSEEYSAIMAMYAAKFEGTLTTVDQFTAVVRDGIPCSLEFPPYFPSHFELCPIVVFRRYEGTGFDGLINYLSNPNIGFRCSTDVSPEFEVQIYAFQQLEGVFALYWIQLVKDNDGTFRVLSLRSHRGRGHLSLDPHLEVVRLPVEAWRTVSVDSDVQDTHYSSQSGNSKKSPTKQEIAEKKGLTKEELDAKKTQIQKERAAKRRKKESKTIFRLQSGVPLSPPLCLQDSVRNFRSQFGLPKIDISPSLHDKFEELTAHVEQFSETMPQIAALLGNIDKSGVAHTISLDATWLHVPATISLFALTYLSITEGGKWMAIAGAFGTVYATTCGYVHKDWLLTKFSRIFSRDADDLRSQSFNLSLIEDLAGAVTGFLALNSSRSFSTSSAKFTSFVTGLRTFDRTKTGLTSAISFAVQTVTRIINWFREEFLGLGAITALTSSIPELDAWVQKVDALQREAFNGTLSVNSENCARVEALRIEGAHLALKKFSAVEAHQVNTALRVYNDVIRKINIPFERANLTGGGCRMEPVVVLMTGAPGVGKTFAMMPVLLKVLEEVMPQEQKDSLGKNYMDHVYPRCPEMKYWDGYRGQFATMYDDFGQARDVAGQPDNEFLEMIRAGNIFPYPLHMADIADKGNTEFASRIILCTTNLEQFTPNSIVSHEAVMRRFNLIVKVVPKKEFCLEPEVPPANRRLDRNHSEIQEGFDPSIYEFHVRKANGTSVGSETTEILSYEGVIQRIVELYRSASARADAYLKCLDGIAKYKSQAGSSKDTGFLKEFAEDFDRQSDLSMMDLDAILRTRAAHKARMSISEFQIWVRDVLKSYPAVDHAFQRQPELFYHAFKVNEKAFRKCVEEKPAMLSELVDALTINYDQKVVDTITYADMKATDVARDTLAQFGAKMKGHTADLMLRFSWLDSWKKALAIGGLAIAFLKKLGFFSWLQSLFSTEKADEDEDIPVLESGGPRMRHPQFKVTKTKSTTFKSEGGVDQGCVQMRDVIIGRNQYLLCYPPSGFKFGFVTFVDGRHLLLPNHFISRIRGLLEDGRLEEDSQLELKNFVTDQTIRLRPLDLERGLVESALSANDMALVYLDQAHAHRKVTSFFVNSAQLKNHEAINVELCHGFKFEEKFGVKVHSTRAHRKAEQVIHNDFENPFVVKDVMEYRAPTEDGDCGMLVIVHSVGFGPGKILGFHIAGSNNSQGIGSVVTREMLEAALAGTKRNDRPLPEVALDYKFQFGVSQTFPGFLELGQTKKIVSQPGSTSLRRSVLHNLWTESPKAPAVLRPREVDGVIIDPMYKAIMNYGVVKPAIDKKLLQIATTSLSASMLKIMHEKGNVPRRYSFEESVLGVPTERYCKSVPRSTSAGFPYILAPVPNFKGKEWYFGKGDEFDLTRPAAKKLREECDLIVEKALRGERSEVIFVDVLKDELRKKQRVRDCETRLISAAPLAYTVVCREFFLAWAVCLTNNNLRVGVGIGINAYSEDWDFLARRLLSVGNNILAGDFKGFDTSHGVFICYMVLGLINAFYNDSDNVVREVLFADIADSVHLCRNIVYVWISGGFPSGHFLTALLQSIANKILHRSAWIRCHPRGIEGLSEYDAHVVDVSYGDDSLVSVSDYAIKFFNYHTISIAMAELGYTYTDEVKVGAGEGPPFRSLPEVAFLKRGFRYEPRLSRYVAPLAIDSILEMLYWTKKGARAEIITKANIEIALRELSLHTKKDFQHWAPLVVSGAREYLEYHPQIVDYEVLQDLTCSMECIW